eukprot:8889298-Lingulodinium_polyedra.AAC.1
MPTLLRHGVMRELKVATRPLVAASVPPPARAQSCALAFGLGKHDLHSAAGCRSEGCMLARV